MQDHVKEEYENPEKRNKEYLEFCDKYLNNKVTDITINSYLPSDISLPVWDNNTDSYNYDGYDLFDEFD